MQEEYLEFIDKYYEEANKIYDGMKRLNGDDYIDHAIEVAYILATYQMDPITIGCALIHEAISLSKLSYDEVLDMFGDESAVIVASIAKISSLKQTFKDSNPEKYRRVIVGLAENPSALFIKFADRLHNLRTLLVHDREHNLYIINETQNVYIPIAHRLGMNKLKTEMEDLCFKYSEEEKYKNIVDKLSATKAELEKSLAKMKYEIKMILDSHNIKYDIISRVKSISGIHKKLSSGRKWEDIYDLLGIRIMVDKVEECYLVIGLIHSNYSPIPKRFKDYISNPKSNMYQSLHTSVFGEDKRIYEIQVRTYEMDEIAEKGVASHWSYKEKIDGKVKNNLELLLETFRTQIEMNDIESNMEFFGNIKDELKRSEIYVFTPKGDVIELPSGSTPVDFAYKIHSEVGNMAVGALVNGKMVKLDYELSSGDLVEMLVKKGHTPSKGWLKFVKTDNAKSRIKSFFYKKERDKYINLGKEMLETECSKRSIDFNETFNSQNISKLCEALNLEDEDDIYFSVATLRFLPTSIFNKLDIKEQVKKKNTLIKKKDNKSLVIIDGRSDILYSLATCCNPVYGEDIIGYITKGFGVKVHSKSCPNVKNNEERLIDAKWGKDDNSVNDAYLKISLIDNRDIMMDLLTLAGSKNISIEAIKHESNGNHNYYVVNFRVKSINDLNSFIEEASVINSVDCVERMYL